jgi:hypothetical protein
MQMTGHKTRSVFERYNIVDEADLFDAARRLEEYSEAKTGSIAKVMAKVDHFQPTIDPANH